MSKSEELSVLSTAPWFDEVVAGDILEAVKTPAAEVTGIISGLSSVGLVVRCGHAWRVSEPLRSELRVLLAGRDRQLYDRVLTKFAEHANGDFRPKLTMIMGATGAELNSRAIAAVGSGDASAFDRLVELVEGPSSDNSDREAFATARILESYSRTRDRRSEFMIGLGNWRAGRKAVGEQSFKIVHELGVRDRAGAISSHLLGLQEYSRGQLDEAISLIQKSIGDLEHLNDYSGLAMCLTSLGRVYKDRYRDTGDEADIAASIDCLYRARDLLKEAKPTAVSATLIALAQAYQASGQLTEAKQQIDDARKLQGDGDLAVRVAIAAIPIYRALDLDPQAEEIGIEALATAESIGLDDLTVARLLNITAATQRKLGNRPRARRSAARSVELGRRLGDSRHLAHALHTLASIQLDQLESGAGNLAPTLDEVRSVLIEARSLLAMLHDRRGIRMVDNTLERCEALELQPTYEDGREATHGPELEL